jgi:HSP20 family protein
MSHLALNVFNELNRMQREMDCFMHPGRTIRRRTPFSGVSIHPARAARSWPLVNIREDADTIHVDALAPGVNPESLEVSMTGDQLTISGERKTLPEGIDSEKVRRSERASGRFTRSTTLPMEVDGDKIEASYKSGLLRITLPKTEAAKPRKIQVNVG